MRPLILLSTAPGAFRLFLAMVVVIHHSFPLRAGGWAVYLFFVLSGYWIARMWEGKYSKSYQPYLTFVISRWWRLIPVFLLCLCLTALNAYLMNRSGTLGLSTEWWLRQVPIIGSASAGRILPPTWSLDVEMQFYLTAPLIIWALGKLKAKYSFILALGFALVTLVAFAGGSPAESPSLPVFLGFFLCGIALYRLDWRPRTSVAIGSLAAFAGIVTIALAFPLTRSGIWQVGSASGQGWAGLAIWPHGLWVTGALICLPYIAWNVRQPAGKFDMTLANLAYPLYLIHWIPREWYYHLRSSEWSPALQAILLLGNFLTALLLAILIEVTIDRWFNRRRAAWVKSRSQKAAIPELTSKQAAS